MQTLMVIVVVVVVDLCVSLSNLLTTVLEEDGKEEGEPQVSELLVRGKTRISYRSCY